jgi:hypothetical protein
MADITGPAKIPADWHQEWLQGFLTQIEEAFEQLEALAMDSSIIINEVMTEKEGEDPMGVRDMVSKVMKAADNAMEVLEEAHNYLNVDPAHIGTD